MCNTGRRPSLPKTGGGTPALLPSAPHRFFGGIPFGVASFVFEACAAELLVAAGTAWTPGHKCADVPVTQNIEVKIYATNKFTRGRLTCSIIVTHVLIEFTDSRCDNNAEKTENEDAAFLAEVIFNLLQDFWDSKLDFATW